MPVCRRAPGNAKPLRPVRAATAPRKNLDGSNTWAAHSQKFSRTCRFRAFWFDVTVEHGHECPAPEPTTHRGETRDALHGDGQGDQGVRGRQDAVGGAALG